MERVSNREKILNEGLKVVHAHGFANASVRDIVAAAGVPQGSFTNHFESKEAFGLEILDLYFAGSRATMRETLLNEALDPVFKDIPADAELFDRGISRGDVPRLWVDVIAHVVMGGDKRQYRFVQDTRYGRAVLAESYEIADIRQAVTRYVARRLIERERALADDEGRPVAQTVLRVERRRRRWHALRVFLLGLIVGIVGLVALVLIGAPPQ